MAGNFEQSERFLAASPRPKRRKPPNPKPGAKMPPESILHITEDRDRHVALVRGLNVRRILELADVTEAARWSVAGKGYVVSTAALADICAMADYTSTPYRVKRFGDDQ